jgi:4-hydroxybutyrate CoA-transferase
VIPFVKDSEEHPDILLTEVSPPDEHGFCSFGASLWNKRREIKEAKLVIAEVNPNLIRTYGDNYVHVSEIDYFVEHIPSGGAPGMGTLAGRMPKEPEPYVKRIAENVSQLIKDGDTIQIGVGRTTEPLVRLGLFDGKHDLGFHSQATPPGVISLVKEGVITGKYKTLHPGKVVVTSIGGSTREEMQWVDNNPLFLLVDVTYLEDIRVIAAHDNMVAINNALAIDLMGQVAAETIGRRVLSVAGGQIPFVIGAWLSKGGRSITVLPSTAQGGTVSRIVPTLPPGTAVTIQRNCVDYVVTEYGIAHLRGKSARQRANELISIAHPDFRAELRKEAEKLFWP